MTDWQSSWPECRPFTLFTLFHVCYKSFRSQFQIRKEVNFWSDNSFNFDFRFISFVTRGILWPSGLLVVLFTLSSCQSKQRVRCHEFNWRTNHPSYYKTRRIIVSVWENRCVPFSLFHSFSIHFNLLVFWKRTGEKKRKRDSRCKNVT